VESSTFNLGGTADIYIFVPAILQWAIFCTQKSLAVIEGGRKNE